MKNVLVVAEQKEGKLKKATLSAIQFARQVSNRTGAKYSIVVIGSSISSAVQSLKKYGASTIIAVEDPVFANYLAQPYAQAIAEVADKHQADIVVAAATTFGKDCLPRVAARLSAGMASDVIGIGTSSDKLTYVRPMWAGNILGEVEITTPRHVITVRQTDFDPAQPLNSDTPVQTFSSGVDAAAVKQHFLEFRPTVSARPDLAEARVVVSGGRGLRSKENFKLVEDLADLLGGAVGATRAAVDAEFIENDYQIGQTGKVVAPELYIAVGLSGAIQHLAGMKNSKVIVAINKDEEAPIFSVADYGMVSDLFKTVPELIQRLKALKAEGKLH